MYEIKNAQNRGGYYKGIKSDHSVPDDVKSDFGSFFDPAVRLILNGKNIGRTGAKVLKLRNTVSEKSSYYFNTDLLTGNIKDVKNLMIKLRK